LEGSTLVKRLKAESRLQYKIGGRIGDQVSDAFGLPPNAAKETTTKLFTELVTQEAKSSQSVSNIMDDLQAYFERRRMMSFKPAIKSEEHAKQADQLAGTQHKLGERIENVIDRIRALKNGEEEFGKEIGLLTKVAEVMFDAKTILARPDTGSQAIAAETEVIE